MISKGKKWRREKKIVAVMITRLFGTVKNIGATFYDRKYSVTTGLYIICYLCRHNIYFGGYLVTFYFCSVIFASEEAENQQWSFHDGSLVGLFFLAHAPSNTVLHGLPTSQLYSIL